LLALPSPLLASSLLSPLAMLGFHIGQGLAIVLLALLVVIAIAVVPFAISALLGLGRGVR